MGLGRKWTASDEAYLSEFWGIKSRTAIASHLGRTETAVQNRVQVLGLGAFFENGDYVTLNQVYRALRGRNLSNYQKKSWEKNRGLPVHIKRISEKRVQVVYLDEFWKWAEENRSFIDFSKMEPYILGEEPGWVAEQRKKDFHSCSLQKKTPWTPAEDEKLKRLLAQQKYGWAELSKMLCRTEGAIQRRCTDLKIMDRPVKADTHGASSVWTDEMYERVADGIRNGDSYSLIGECIGKSEKAVRGKVYYMYLTEDADKVRKMIGDGKWGDGAPEPKVYQGVTLSRTRTGVRNDLSRLAGLLQYRRNELGYEPYWQRFMCMKWDDFKGCTAGCDNCDECIEFERIRPQYCARCGETFFERNENVFCLKCRVARKKKAQRKWMRRMAQGV